MNRREYYLNNSEYEKCKVKEWVNSHKDEYNEYQRNYNKSQRNIHGQTLNNVRQLSNHYLFKRIKHNKLNGYQIHHCYGYDDPHKFIYINKELHKAIHNRLREMNIDAKSNHYKFIKDLIDNCSDYLYISK